MPRRVGFLDMDGVLVNFVGGVCRAHGRPNPYASDPSALGVFDMDKVWGMSARDFWKPVNEDPAFWDGLEKMPDADRMVDSVLSLFDEVAILTAPSMDPQCVPGKRRWIRRYYPQFSEKMVFTGAKQFLAHPDSFLVDDRDKNVEQFAAAGGMGILVPRPWNSDHEFSDRSAEVVSERLMSILPVFSLTGGDQR